MTQETAVDDSRSIRPAQWFLPTDSGQQRPVAGTYEILANGQPEIRLHAPWDESRYPSFHTTSEEYQLLHGNVYGRAVTAVGNELRAGSFSMNTLIDYRTHPQYTLEGLFLARDELQVTNVVLILWDQDSWTKWSSFTVNRGPQDQIEAIMIDHPSPLTAKHDGVTIRLCDAFTSQHSLPADYVSLRSQSRFELDFSEPVSIEQLLADWIEPLETLVMTATGRPSGIAEMRLTNMLWGVQGNEEPSRGHWVTMRAAHPSRTAIDQRRLRVRHSLTELNFERQIPKLFGSAQRFRFALDQYESLVSNRAGGALVRCTVAAQMVESLDRVLHPEEVRSEDIMLARSVRAALTTAAVGNSNLRRSIERHVERWGGSSLEDRLRRLDLTLGSPVSELLNTTSWARYVAHVRNVVAHGLESSVILRSDLRATRVATLICMMLFEAHWLRQLGFSESAIVAKFREDGYRLAFIQANHASMERLTDLQTAESVAPRERESEAGNEG